MDTSTVLKSHQLQGVEVRWPVTLVTSQGHIDGEAQAITARGMLISCLQPPPMEGSFQVLVKIPNRQTLNAIARPIWTSVASVDDGGVRLGTELEFSSISDGDRQFLQGIIARHYQQKMLSGSGGTKSLPPLSGQSKTPAKDRALKGAQGLKIRAYYNQGGKSIEAYGTHLSTQGCLIFSKRRPPAARIFSLKVRNPLTGGLIPVDSSIIQSKHLPESNHWGTMLRFMNLTEEKREEIRKIVETAAAKRSRENQPHSQKTKIGQVIQRYFGWRKA
jgi:hypothetical protein